MSLNINAIIDNDYFDTLWDGEVLGEGVFDAIVNAISTSFEKFCNRNLIERTYTYVEEDHSLINKIIYSPEYSIFDGPRGNNFYFPTYPITSITSFSISGTAITEAAITEYEADDYYKLYKNRGLLVYEGGFDYGYYQNVLTVWKGGYASGSMELEHLKYLCYLCVKDYINAPENMQIQSESIGNYKYSLMSSSLLTKLQGYSPNVFSELASNYRREVFE